MYDKSIRNTCYVIVLVAFDTYLTMKKWGKKKKEEKELDIQPQS